MKNLAFFYNKNGDIILIEKTDSIDTITKISTEHPEIDNIQIAQINNSELRDLYYDFYIHKFKPTLNQDIKSKKIDQSLPDLDFEDFEDFKTQKGNQNISIGTSSVGISSTIGGAALGSAIAHGLGSIIGGLIIPVGLVATLGGIAGALLGRNFIRKNSNDSHE